MRFEILNVEHGFCAYAIGSDGGVLLFDCGHGSVNRPSTYLPDRGITNIHRFFVTNYDEDHISDPARRSPESPHRGAHPEREHDQQQHSLAEDSAPQPRYE